MGTDSGVQLQLASGASNGVHLGVASTRPSFGVVKSTAKSLTTSATNTAGLAYLGTGLPVALNVANTGDGAFWIEDAITAPTATVTGAGALYSNSGALTWWDGTTAHDLTAGGGGSSLWTDNTNRITDENYGLVEIIDSGFGNTYSGTYSFGNLVIGNSNTSTNLQRTFILGNSHTTAGTSTVSNSIVSGTSNELKYGSYNFYSGTNVNGGGDDNIVVGNANNVYGDKNVALGQSITIGASGAEINNSVAIGKSITIQGNEQIAIGRNIDMTFSSTENHKAIFFGLNSTRPTVGIYNDPGSADGSRPSNFSMGSFEAMRDAFGIKNNHGGGIFQFHNYLGTATVEPTALTADMSRMWGWERASGKMGHKFESEDGTNQWFGDFSVIGGDETSSNANKTLTVVGTGTTSGTSSLQCEDSAGTATLEVRDDGVVIMAGLPTSATGLPTGALWNNSGVINIV